MANFEQVKSEELAIPSGLTSAQLSKGIESIVKKDRVPAIAVVIASQEQTRKFAKGVRRHGSSVAVTENDCFMIGPLSSTMITFVLARLVERNLLRWSDTLKELLPGFGHFIHVEHHSTTVEMLNAHISGITTKFPELEDGQLASTLTLAKLSGHEGRKETCFSALKNPPERRPGPGSSYRNAVNLMILALIIEMVMGMDWDTIMKTEVFEPLKMQDSAVGPPRELDAVEIKVPWPHEFRAEMDAPHALDIHERGPWLSCEATYPALGVHATLDDVGKYLGFCLHGPTDAVGANVRDGMFASTAGSDFKAGAFDTITDDWTGGLALRCVGHVSGFSTGTWIASELGFAFSILVNVDGSLGASARDKVYRLITSTGATS